MTITALIDGDPIVYRDGYMSEEHTYEVIALDDVGHMHQLHFDNGDKKKEFFKNNPGWEIEDSTRLVVPEPISHALHLVKKTLRAIVNELEDKYKDDVLPVVYLSGPDNWRLELASIREYKGNRPPDKPHHYQNIRDYLCNRWDAHVVEGREADDEISIAARKNKRCVVCTIDKDLDQVPGKHFDIRTKVHYHVSQYEATRYFYCQALSGDSGDNIGGCFRIGPTGAEKLIDTWAEEWNAKVKGRSGTTAQLERYWWAKIVQEYANSVDRETAKLKCEYKDRHPEDVAVENARLVKMQEYVGQLWTPPGQPDMMWEDWT